MSGLTDIHAHIIPGVDDGPSNIAETVELLRSAFEDGIRTMVATPHMFMPLFPRLTPESVRAAFSEMTAELTRLSDENPGAAFLSEMEVLLGAENYCASGFLSALEAGNVVTINDGRYLLLEFEPRLAPAAMEGAVRAVQSEGLQPILAHVERYAAFHADEKRLAAFVESGCLAQVNAESVLAPRWSSVRRTIFRWLESSWVTIVATDAHGAVTRRPRLGGAAQVLERRFGPDRADLWTRSYPQSVIRS